MEREGTFDVLVRFPDETAVVVKHAHPEWSVAAFVDQLSLSCKATLARQIDTVSEKSSDDRSKVSGVPNDKRGLFLLTSKDETVIIALVDPCSSNGLIAEDLNAIGRYGIDTDTSELSLVRPTKAALKSLEMDIEILRKQHGVLSRKEAETNRLIGDIHDQRSRKFMNTMENISMGNSFKNHCERVVKDVIRVAAANTVGYVDDEDRVKRGCVAIHWGKQEQVVNINDGKDANNLTCGDLAKGACVYFQQDVDGAALQDYRPRRNRRSGRRSDVSDVPVWPPNYPIVDAIAESGTCHFNLYSAKVYEDVLMKNKNEDAVRSDDVGINEDDQIVHSRLRRLRLRQEWLFLVPLLIVSLVLQGWDIAKSQRNYEFNSLTSKFNKIVSIIERHNSVEIIGDPNDVGSNTMILSCADLLFSLVDSTDNSFSRGYKLLASQSVNQFRVLDHAGCPSADLLSVFDSSTAAVDTTCSTCSLICNSYYDRDVTMSTRPYFDFDAPFVVQQDAEIGRISGQFATYDKIAFQADASDVSSAYAVFKTYINVENPGNLSNENLTSAEKDGLAVLTKWIDQDSRAITLTNVFYNWNFDMIAWSTTIWEYSLVGGVTTTIKIQSSNLAYSPDPSLIVTLTFIAIVLVAFLYVDVSEILAVLVAPTKNYKEWIRFIFFDNVHIYVNVTMYVLFVCICAYTGLIIDKGVVVRNFMKSNIAYSATEPWNTLTDVDFTSFYDDFDTYMSYERYRAFYISWFVIVMWMKVVSLAIEGIPSFKRIIFRLSVALFSFGLLMMIISLATFFLILAVFGDNLYVASTIDRAFELSLLLYVGNYDNDAMYNVNKTFTYIAMIYMFVPVLLFNVSLAIMIVELPWNEKSLHEDDEYISVTFIHKRPLAWNGLRWPRWCGGRHRESCFRINKRGLCSCFQIHGNGDVENPLIWAYHFAKRLREDGTPIRMSTYEKLKKQFFVGRPLDDYR